MKIFLIDGDVKYQWLTLCNGADFEQCPKTYTPAYVDTRALLSMVFCRLVPLRKEGDFRWLDPSFTCRDATLAKIIDTVERDVQLLDLTVDDEDDRNYLLHPTNQLQAVDMSVLQPLMDTKGVKWIRHYAFKREVFQRPQLFTDRYFSGQIFYVTEVGEPKKDFYLRCTNLELTGIKFTQVWEG